MTAGAIAFLGRTRSSRIGTGSLLLLLAITVPQASGAVSRGGAAAPRTHWVGSWTASPSDAASSGFANQTLRMMITPHLGGSILRLHLSNRFGTQPLVLGRVSIAVRRAGASLQPGTLRPVRFDGRSIVTIPAGADVRGDAVHLRFHAFQTLAVSIFVSGTSGPVTRHLTARQTSYLTAAASGDHSAATSGDRFTIPTRSWYLIVGLDVRAPQRAGAVVTFGDSITNGAEGLNTPFVENPSGVDRNGRYPDDLARRLRKAHRMLSVLNAGISGNSLLGSTAPPLGPSGLSRLRDDVLRQAGVRDVIVLEGINDISLGNATAAQVINALKKLVARLHHAKLRVLIGTLTPAGDNIDAATDVTRVRVNRWIRHSRVADGVADFDKALRDPKRPSDLQPRYDSSDHLHPSLAGYRAMAMAVPLNLLR